MQTMKIILSHDYDNVVSELKKFRRGDTDGFLKRIDADGTLLMSVAAMKDKMECDVLIIEDNPEHIIKYFRILEKFSIG